MNTAPEGLGHPCTTLFADDCAQGRLLLELAAAYRAARRKKFEASDDDFPAVCVTLLKATNDLLAAALDCTDDASGEEST